MKIILVILGVITWMYWINVVNPPKYLRPPPHTKQEKKVVKWALRYHGIQHLITTPKRIYFERDGQEITIRRRP